MLQNNSDLLQVANSKQLLSAALIQPCLLQTKQLISSTNEDYGRFYLSAIHTIAESLQQFPKPVVDENKERSLLQWSLKHAIAVLKFRRAYMLPMGADTETCYAEQDVWTYALFTATLLQACRKIVDCFDIAIFDKSQQNKIDFDFQNNLKMPIGCFYQFTQKNLLIECEATIHITALEKLLPKAGLDWLQSCPTVYAAWTDALSHCPAASNSIGLIIKHAETALLQLP